MITILVLMLIVLLVLNVPVGFALLAASMASLAYGGVPMALVVQRMTTAADSFVLLAIPLFIFAGALMSRGGMAQAIFDFAEALVGFIRGGLAQVNIATSMFFGGITGAAVADTSAVGSIMIRPMLERGFDRGLTAAVTASSSTIGVMIPPSIPMILFAVVTGVSLGQLFLAGIVPGIIVGLVLMFTTWLLLRNSNVPVTSFNWPRVGRTFIVGLPALLTPVIIIGGILTGVVTPTEAAVLAVAYALLLGMVTRRLRWPEIVASAIETAVTTGAVMIMVAAASLYGLVLTREQVPADAASLISGMTESPMLLLFLIVLLYLVAGAILDLGANIIILVPVLYPVVQEFGVDPVHFGVITIVALAIGLVTPPVGICLFVASSIAEIGITEASRAVVPFFFALLAVLVLIIFVPDVALWLPRVMR
ncbi:TRAP transporter large permease [uncultured Jannaschia sp.]|uniref:TRAP transporter large permease n=1 Tax=uncultured Jannaschia sp. TaxID=293347 RepID=UPI0026296861|nr:TRAP transporter large permease [uncultured Jannaschia sp.]